jgi:hypothetical protein
VHAGAWARLFRFVSLMARWMPSCALAGCFAAPNFPCFRWSLGCDDDWVPVRIYTPGRLQINKHKQNTAQMASSLATFDLNVPVPEAEEGNAGLDLNEPVLEDDNDIGNEPVLEDDNDIGKFASLLPCFLASLLLD